MSLDVLGMRCDAMRCDAMRCYIGMLQGGRVGYVVTYEKMRGRVSEGGRVFLDAWLVGWWRVVHGRCTSFCKPSGVKLLRSTNNHHTRTHTYTITLHVN